MGKHNERKFLKTYYGPSWHKKVDEMSDKQVMAVYLRLRMNQNKV